MPLYRVYDFLFPVCVPLEFDGNLFDVPRRPFPYAWTVGAIRNLQIWKARRDCRPFRSAEENRMTDPTVYTAPNSTGPSTLTTSSPFITCCSLPQSRYVDYSSRKWSRRFWQFVYDRLSQAADWVYDNKL